MTSLRSFVLRYWLTLILIPFSLTIGILAVRVNDAHTRQTVQSAVLAQDRQAITELCKTNAIIEGLVTGTITLFQYEVGLLPAREFRGPDPPLRDPLINPTLVPAFLAALATFQGWKVELSQQTACERINKP